MTGFLLFLGRLVDFFIIGVVAERCVVSAFRGDAVVFQAEALGVLVRDLQVGLVVSAFARLSVVHVLVRSSGLGLTEGRRVVMHGSKVSALALGVAEGI